MAPLHDPNCTLVIPVPSSHRSPDLESAPRIIFQLHREQLSAKSLFFRGLFSGASPIELIQTLSASRLPPSTPLRIHRSRLPRLLPSPPSHPIIFLPIPDPSSIHALFHWMYSGNTDRIETALDKGDIHWEGLARNVEYLGISADIKVILGRWYRTWHLPARSPCPADEDDESDLDYDEFDASLPSDEDEDEDEEDEIWGEDCDRGRPGDIKHLVRLCGRLRVCTA